MNSANPAPILIAGGGIGGLAAALALSLQGYKSHVLEQASKFSEIGAGIQLGPNVFRMFERLGVEQSISAKAVFVDAVVMMDSLDESLIARIPMGDACRAKFGKAYAVSHRADILNSILEGCQARPGDIQLSTNAKVVSYENTAGGVRVTLADGGTIDGSALIGADGLWSGIREKMVGDKVRVSGHIAYRALLPLDQVPENMRFNEARLWAGPRNHFVHYPLRNWEVFNLVAVFHSDTYVEGWNEPGDRVELMERFSMIGPRPMSLLTIPKDWRMWVLCDREPISEWTDGRVTLLGDAAHPMLQYLAQGACMAIEDAVCLADKVMETGGDVAAAFLAYQQARYLRTARVQVTARYLGDLYHAAGPVRELRKEMLSSGPPGGGLTWLYEGP